MKHPSHTFAILALSALALMLVARPALAAGADAQPDWKTIDDEGLRYFRDYLRFDTTNPPDNTAAAIAYLKAILDKEGIQTATFESKPGAVTLVAKLPGPADVKPFLLLSHADVVPAVAANWSHPPFGADLADGYVWARGAIDNKAHGIMAVMTLLELKRQNVPLKRGVELMINPDEEAGAEDGAAWMAAKHWDAFDPAFAVNEGGTASPDPFGGSEIGFDVAVAEKRVFWLHLTVRGKSGHGSMPNADNPNLILINSLYRLFAAPPQYRVTPQMAEAFEELARHAPEPAATQLAHLDRPERLDAAARGPLAPYYLLALIHDTIAPTMLNSGIKVNVIPSTADAGLDVRLLPGTNANAFLKRMRELLADSRISIEVLQQPDEAPPSPTSGEAWDAIHKVVDSDFKGAYVAPWMTAGGTDSRYLREHNVPAYGFVPIVLDRGELGRVHGVDERLSVENLNRGIKANYDLTIDLCAQK